MQLLSHITEIVDGEGFYAFTPFRDTYLIEKRRITDCETRLDDGRTISADQRKKIYATLRDMSIYTGHTPEELKNLMKCEYVAKTGHDYFSLSNVDMTTANDFLTFLIDFCLEWDIPASGNLLERSPDVARYLYLCLVRKKCCITGRKAELHHVDAVGVGRDRKDIIHKGMRVLPLTRKMHTEAHALGRDSFCSKYHVFGIKLDADLCKIWNVRG